MARLTAAAPTPAASTEFEKQAKTLRYQIEQQQRFIEAELKHGARE
jgi:hypothetical protein